MTGRAASGPMSPSPSTAVPSVTMATVLPLIVRSWTRSGWSAMARAHPGDAGRVGHREVVAVGDRHVGEHLDLAALVQLEGAVDPLEHLDAGTARDRARRPARCGPPRRS